MTIGTRIRELRQSHHYSQEYVAEQLGVSRQAVSKWEQDHTAPDTYNLIALADLFGVSVEYIAVGKKNEVPDAQKTLDGENNEKEAEATPSLRRWSYAKITAIILLGAALLSLILGILFSVVLMIIALYLAVGSVILWFVHKHRVLVTAWTYFVLSMATIVIPWPVAIVLFLALFGVTAWMFVKNRKK